jgi:precorrin-6B C5,15-methyltransferase / cobalt-precorrin-6B C5,C15-methyltransferase
VGAEPVTVVGIGADGWAGLSPAARDAVAHAEVLLGGRRQLDLVPAGPAERREWPSPMLPALPGLFAGLAGQRVCALASGDPMLYGLGATLARVLGADRLRVLPQPSSVALACARLGWPAQEVTVVSAVGRPLEALARELAPGRRVLVLVPDADGPSQVARLLVDRGYGPSGLTVLEQLGGPGERQHRGTAEAWAAAPGDPLAVVAVACVAAPGTVPLSRAPGLPDDAYEHDGQLTKQEVRAVTLARLAPLPGRLLWDVGAGSGSIGIEYLRAEPSARVLAVERDPVRAQRAARNAARLGVPALRVLTGAAPDALTGLDTPDTVFVGGAVGVPGVLEACWAALRPGGRLVANAVTLEGEAALIARRSRHGGALTRLEVQRAAPVGGLTAFRPALPVTQWVADKPC